MGRKKIVYSLQPGYVVSSNDLERHYVSDVQLLRLYGVRRDRCLNFMAPRDRDWHRKLSTVVVLKPKNNGDYSLVGKT